MNPFQMMKPENYINFIGSPEDMTYQNHHGYSGQSSQMQARPHNMGEGFYHGGFSKEKTPNAHEENNEFIDPNVRQMLLLLFLRLFLGVPLGLLWILIIQSCLSWVLVV
jgi:hypothetical protein